MPPHFLVVQLRFARSEMVRCLAGVSEEDAVKRLPPLNSLSWIVGHLANQENFFWNMLAQGVNAAPGLNDRVGYGKPASTPPLAEMWAVWQAVTAQADAWLDVLTEDKLRTHFEFKGRTYPENIGTQLLRTTYHYWYHTGEAAGIRQALGHTNLPEFVGDMTQAKY